MDRQPGHDAARTNQARTEPLPATPESPPGQEAVRRNEELGTRGTEPGTEDSDRSGGGRLPSAVSAGVPAADAPLGAPGVQATRAAPGDPWRADTVANAVHGKPDGEVDTRADQPSHGTEEP
ncbi:hypothetical protein NI17_000295 [Thermobifida halotolerans]|uniref:Uncharacterized protein n=1 Tax=Thermobifida halotolerans TaxID=483545 RepID=A0A399G5J9_9ACTN|nr:hypothetical protein [Thermobifida halotolerans]UOE19751.1 hypothetical protein NI17_000295 [Thermobifida halotolerans]